MNLFYGMPLGLPIHDDCSFCYFFVQLKAKGKKKNMSEYWMRKKTNMNNWRGKEHINDQTTENVHQSRQLEEEELKADTGAERGETKQSIMQALLLLISSDRSGLVGDKWCHCCWQERVVPVQPKKKNRHCCHNRPVIHGHAKCISIKKIRYDSKWKRNCLLWK